MRMGVVGGEWQLARSGALLHASGWRWDNVELLILHRLLWYDAMVVVSV